MDYCNSSMHAENRVFIGQIPARLCPHMEPTEGIALNASCSPKREPVVLLPGPASGQRRLIEAAGSSFFRPWKILPMFPPPRSREMPNFICLISGMIGVCSEKPRQVRLPNETAVETEKPVSESILPLTLQRPSGFIKAKPIENGESKLSKDESSTCITTNRIWWTRTGGKFCLIGSNIIAKRCG